MNGNKARRLRETADNIAPVRTPSAIRRFYRKLKKRYSKEIKNQI